MNKRNSGGTWSGPALVLALGASLGSLGAQDLSDMVSICGAPSEAHMAWCQEAALAVQAAQGALGLSATGGIDLPGSASTLGWRTKGSPRFALSAWGSLTRAPVPAMASSGGLPSGEATASVPAVHLSGAMGLFDGFSLGPTAGGFGSLDLTIAGRWTGKAGEGGFQEGAGGWGMGGRLGILRESFSLPGLTVTGYRWFLGDHRLWRLLDGDPVEATFDLEVSSLRGMIGKDLWGIGFFGGVGWDRYDGKANLMVRDPQGGGVDSNGSGRIQTDRRLAFVGASRTFLAFQLSGEMGWGEGFDPSFSGLSSPQSRTFDPSAASYFGSLAVRLTF